MIGLIEVASRPSYGTSRLYPVNAEAFTLARIAGTKTLDIDVLREARSLGFAVKVIGHYDTGVLRLQDTIDAPIAPRPHVYGER